MKGKEKIKYLVLGMIIMAVLSTMVVPAMAEMVQKQITILTGVNIYVDDVKLNPVDVNGRPVEVFIYNGTTYLPVRAVAEAVEKAVSWDGKTRSVFIGKHDSEEPAVMLHELDYFDSGGGTFKTYTDVKDNLGNTYDYGMEINARNGWRTYFINGKYSKMKGRYILNYDYRSTKIENRFKVYGDGKLLYSSPVMTGGVHPIDFEIDLAGVLELKIEITHDGSTRPTYLVNTGLYQ
ncbi:MAG: copper amine oxidase [Tissierellia bacterium]|nr:copper amine oxidase [Tissierellia bacterium]